MIILVVIFLAAALISYLALQNITPVTVTLFHYTFTFVPLYIIGLVSLFTGLLLGWVLTLKQKFFTYRAIHGKDKSIQEYKAEITDLRKRIHDLENDNEHLRELTGRDTTDDKSL